MKHTPEPWAYEAGKGHHEGTIVITSYTMSASSPLALISDICCDAEIDARRIVACVNACAGIPDSVLLVFTGENCNILVSNKLANDQLAAVTAQRDDLLAALKYVRADSGYHLGRHRPHVLQAIDEAIAKAAQS